MNRDNPYQAPAAWIGHRQVKRELRPPWVWTCCLWLVGVCFLLLLDGQFFRNALVFLGCIVLSLGLWLWFAIRSADSDHRRIAIYVILGHAGIVIWACGSLPAAYEGQLKFNNTRERIRQRMSAEP
jgi:hypothetical protein